jgi:hypothetical protein
MSKKAKLYLLVIVNLIAWGYVGYKIYAALQGDDDFELNNEKTEIKKIEVVNKEDTVLLSLNYPDPFLKGGNFSKENRSHSTSQTSHVSNSPKPVVNLKPKQEIPQIVTDIKYVGLVKNSDKGTQTAMITINGKSYFVKQKDVVEGYTILEVSKDFIKLKKGKEILMINK